jgi:LysM repeat protein
MIPTSGKEPEYEIKDDELKENMSWEGEGGRCERCGLYFSTAEERVAIDCVSHPGTFNCDGYGLTWKVSLGRWSCCGSSDESAGCIVSKVHTQCQKTLDALKKIDSGEVVKDSDGNSLQGNFTLKSLDLGSDRPTEKENSTEIEKNPSERQGFIRHVFKAGETLPGLALMYNVSVQDIKRSNGIVSSFLDPGFKFLWIPLPGTEPEQSSNLAAQGVSKLRGLAAAQGLQINLAEAKYYLDEEAGDVSRALAAFKDDLDWERQNSGKSRH